MDPGGPHGIERPTSANNREEAPCGTRSASVPSASLTDPDPPPHKRIRAAPPPLSFASERLTFELGVAPSLSLRAEGGQPPYRFASIDPLPAGLELAEGGQFRGLPTEPSPATWTEFLAAAQTSALRASGSAAPGPAVFGLRPADLGSQSPTPANNPSREGCSSRSSNPPKNQIRRNRPHPNPSTPAAAATPAPAPPPARASWLSPPSCSSPSADCDGSRRRCLDGWGHAPHRTTGRRRADRAGPNRPDRAALRGTGERGGAGQSTRMKSRGATSSHTHSRFALAS